MGDLLSGPTDSLDLAAEREIDAMCLRFESAWKAGQRPRIEDDLAGTEEPTRSALLEELLRLEIDYRGRLGEVATEAEYALRFPALVGVVARAFARVPRGPLPQVPGYKVVAEIGRGGMGVVYKAWQVKAERFVALKMVLAGEMASEDEVERFKAEARAAARLEHPGIVPVYEVGEHEGRHFFTMKLVPDGSLADQVAHSPLPSRQAAEVLLAVARAVHYAHQHKVIHRDLKPANILLDAAGVPHVTDFGLAKRLDSPDARTGTGNVLGTPGYMAPELAAGRGKEPTPATDVYGLGAVLYALLTGRPPFQAESLLDTLTQVLHELPAPPRLLNPNIDSDLETVCLKCLEKNPRDRYVTAEELAEELGCYRRGEAIQARPLSYVSRRMRKRREVVDPRSWSYLSLIGAAATLVTHLALFWITQPGGPLAWFWPLLCAHAGVTALVIWRFLLRRGQPFSPEERDICAIYGSVIVTGFALFGTAYPYGREDILAVYPALALLSGLYHLFIARLYWGPFYLPGLAYYLLAVVMKMKPEWAPLEYGALAAAHGLFNGLVMRWHRKG